MDAMRARRDEVEATRAFAEHYFRRWDDARHESLATRTLARASADVRAMSNALLLGGVRDVSRRDAALRAMWTRWIAYVSLRELAPRLCGDLVRHDCAIVAWKHWVYATKDALARSRVATEMGAKARERRARSENRIDARGVNAARLRNLSAARRERQDEVWGFHMDARPPGGGWRKRREEAKRAKRAAGDDDDERERERDDDSDDDARVVMDFEAHSHTTRAWRAWKDAKKARLRDEDATAALLATAEAAREGMRARVEARAAARVEDKRRQLERVARKKSLERFASELKGRELELNAADGSRVTYVAAVKLQSAVRGWLERRRYEKKKSNPFERVAGLRELLDRGDRAFSAQERVLLKAKDDWAASERRLTRMMLTNDDAIAALRVATETLRRVLYTCSHTTASAW